jgi:hypothetical protein
MNTAAIAGRTAFAALVLMAAACATSYTPPKNPPPLGPDLYKCIGSKGSIRYVNVNANTFRVWREGQVWGENACTVEGQSCTVDEAGKITVRQVIVLERTPRMDLTFVYDLKAGTETQFVTINGSSTTPTESACTPFTS